MNIPSRGLLLRAAAMVCCAAACFSVGRAAAHRTIVVDKAGCGDARTIQEAVNAVPRASGTPTLIFIRNGLYAEKVYLRGSNITLMGEHRDSTRIVFAELRENWHKEHGGSDWGAGVVNIDTGAHDITLANLTVSNNYGWQHGVFNKHQFAVRGAGTRIMLLHCTITSDGGDALSLWNREDGMYYHADCRFEGWVDFVCPRGWCYITNSTFFGHNRPSASLWHDGSGDKRQKLVIRNSHFDGVPGFPLGRNHLDGQIYLIDCTFSRNMADRPFYRPPSSPREWQWGARHYFHNCHREGGDFMWFRDNLDQAEGSPRADQVTARWAFDGRWDPESLVPGIFAAAGPLLQSDSCWSHRMARSFMERHPDSIAYPTEKRAKWNYEQGLMLESLRQLWKTTHDYSYLLYIRSMVDRFVTPDGDIQTYEFDTFNLDNIAKGRQLLFLFQQTGAEKYRRAADLLRRQLAQHPRTPSGGYWHKKIYPNQMWLDGLYMAQPFLVQYARLFDEPSIYDDVIHQFVLIESRTRDSLTGLLYHAWDESRSQRWADPHTGRSPHFWGRAMGWYAMALIDVLDEFPSDHPGRERLVTILRRLAEALKRHQDPRSGLWYQVVDQSGREGNYLEASASCMYVYVFAKGAAKGYLTPEYGAIAQRSFQSILDSMVTVDPGGLVSLHQGCSVAGLGGNPYRDGSYEYYIGEPKRTNDFKAVGPFILAAHQLEQMGMGCPGAK